MGDACGGGGVSTVAISRRNGQARQALAHPCDVPPRRGTESALGLGDVAAIREFSENLATANRLSARRLHRHSTATTTAISQTQQFVHV